MDHFLFVQWKTPTDASRYVIDGISSEYSATKQQVEVMKYFAGVPRYREICKNRGRKDLSPSFRCSYARISGKRRAFIEGNFEETDLAGRKLVYLFSSIESNPDKIVEILKNYSSLLGVTPNANDLEEIKRHSFNNKIKVRLWITIMVIATLLFSLLIH